MDSEFILEGRDIRKSFGGVHALKGVTMTMRRGEITALIGDNGCGKTTLVRCFAGVHAPDSGSIVFNGRSVTISTPARARELGIETVHQSLALVEDLTVWQNFFLGREITRRGGPLHFLDRRAMREQASERLNTLAVNVPPVTSRVRRLSGGQRQAVAIARAAGWSGQIVIMDEPTAALGVQETERVEATIRALRDSGVSVLLISHNFSQVLRLSDSVWVMRAGEAVAQRRASETDGDELVALITGAKAS